jgi:hypothetical protein
MASTALVNQRKYHRASLLLLSLLLLSLCLKGTKRGREDTDGTPRKRARTRTTRAHDTESDARNHDDDDDEHQTTGGGDSDDEE